MAGWEVNLKFINRCLGTLEKLIEHPKLKTIIEYIDHQNPKFGQVLLFLEINLCEEHSPCAHGTCEPSFINFTCNCESGWAGPTCGEGMIDLLYLLYSFVRRFSFNPWYCGFPLLMLWMMRNCLKRLTGHYNYQALTNNILFCQICQVFGFMYYICLGWSHSLFLRMVASKH